VISNLGLMSRHNTSGKIYMQMIAYLSGCVRVLNTQMQPSRNMMHTTAGILLQPKSAKDRSPSLGRLSNLSLNMQLPFMEWNKISFVSEETPKARMLV